MTAAQREAARRRVGGRCEYCRLPDAAMEPEDFHVEHIIAKKHRGPDDADNLAWVHILQSVQGSEPRQPGPGNRSVDKPVPSPA